MAIAFDSSPQSYNQLMCNTSIYDIINNFVSKRIGSNRLKNSTCCVTLPIRAGRPISR